jgi:hypothetical protein
LERYVAELDKKMPLFKFPKPQAKGKRRPGPRSGTTGLLHLTKQIAVLVQLTTLFANNGNPISKTAELEKQVSFLVSVLRGATTFSQQQIIDLEQLLAVISAHIKATSTAKPWEYFRYSLHRKERAIDMSLPLQQLKTHWQMCMTCGELMFGIKAENTQCSLEGCDALLKKPVFGFP